MIYINYELFTPNTFPDGTYRLQFDPIKDDANEYTITWLFDNDSECMQLYYLVHHIRDHCDNPYISLYMPYIPNARMDRVKHSDEVFTLKWFAKFINDLNFNIVYVCDPHSDVSTALINKVDSMGARSKVNFLLDCIDPGYTVLCFPDAGSAKKYADQFPGIPYVCCSKNREWSTGKLLGLTLNDPDVVCGKTVLIVDDICSRGGTFMLAAQALKEAGADEIHLYVTHCENTVFEGDLLTSELIEHIYTTNSIYRGDHSKISVL